MARPHQLFERVAAMGQVHDVARLAVVDIRQVGLGVWCGDLDRVVASIEHKPVILGNADLSGLKHQAVILVVISAELEWHKRSRATKVFTEERTGPTPQVAVQLADKIALFLAAGLVLGKVIPGRQGPLGEFAAGEVV